MSGSDYRDAWDRLTGGDRMRTPCGRHPGAGEYDALAQLSRRTLRQLRGGEWLSARGVPVDVLADRAFMSCDDFISEYVRLVLLVIRETRGARYRRQYARRAARAVQAGYASFWHYRKAMQWTGTR